MKKYSVLLVDDEEEVFQVIIKKLDWESMGFVIAGYAKNGLEALEMAEELQPDVVMTDIKMPYMDGLELSKKLRALYRNLKIIIFSGFDEFEYAKEAIKIEAAEYILKPIDSGELRKVFERVKEDLDRELDEKRNIDKLKDYYMESLPILQENFFISLIEGRIPMEKMEQYLADYRIEFSSPCYITAVLHCSTSDQQLEMDPFLLTLSVKRLSEEALSEQWSPKIFPYLRDVVVIGQLADREQVTEFTDDLDRFCKLAKRVCSVSVTAGVGYLCYGIEELAASYNGARAALSYRVFYGNTQAINIAEIEPRNNAEASWEESSYSEQIFKAVKMGDGDTLSEAVSRLVNFLVDEGSSLQKYRILIMELIVDIFRFGNNNQLNMEKIFGQSQDMYTEVLQLESREAVKKWLLYTAGTMQDMLRNERIDSTKSFVIKATEYVKEHYSNQNLTVDMICHTLGVSAAYFSTVFKKETGKTFINYLTDYRMDRAAEYLLTTDDRTYIIAEKVGYLDPNYFSYVFKKKFGMSPLKYRREKMNAYREQKNDS